MRSFGLDQRLDFVTQSWNKNPHVQTCFPAMFSPEAKTPLLWEEVNLPDGDFVDVCWAGQQNLGPTLVMLHGLEGSVYSHYIQSSLDHLVAQGWRVAVMHLRGCGRRINRLRRAYHSGDTADLHYVINMVVKRFPHTPVMAVGFSLGGNILLKYLSEQRHSSQLIAACAVSVPFDLGQTTDFIYPVYQQRLLRCMTVKLAEKMQLGHRYPLAMADIKNITSLRDFDNAITCDLYGYDNADDYYEQESCGSRLGQITVPTLILHALDDPFIPASCVPSAADLPANCQLEITPYGGHVGFVSGMPWKPVFWMPHRMIRYFNTQLS